MILVSQYITAGAGATPLLPAGNYFIRSLFTSYTYFQATAAGGAQANWNLRTAALQSIWRGTLVENPAGAGALFFYNRPAANVIIETMLALGSAVEMALLLNNGTAAGIDVTIYGEVLP